VQCLLRHALSETISEGFINCLIVTNSKEANIQLTRIHEHIFARDPTVAAVWRRQTFSAAVETCTPDMAHSILTEQIPHITRLLDSVLPSSVLESAYHFSRMLHGTAGSGDAFYRAFVPELGSTLYPQQIELVKRCLKNERGEVDRVGCTMFPGLVKVGLDNIHVRASLVGVPPLALTRDADGRETRASDMRMCDESVWVIYTWWNSIICCTSYTTNKDARVA